MKKIFTIDKISHFFKHFNSATRIAILSHTNPDGDAIGSSLSLKRGLELLDGAKDKDIRIFTPNRMPSYLEFLDTERDVEAFSDNERECAAFLAAADLLIMVDFNDTSRLEKMGEAVERNIFAPRILIDHHQSPPRYDLEFHSVDSSSAGLLVHMLLEALEVKLTKEIAQPLYTAMMTDTGGFMFGNLSEDLYTALSKLAATGLDIIAVNRAIFNRQSEDRVRLVGHLLSNKMKVDYAHKSAYIWLTLEEKEQFNFKPGDTEGVVNMPLTIDGIEFSVLLIEGKEHIKLSLRSTDMVDVNLMSREHFNGGGHKNASGGKLFVSMESAIEKVEDVIKSL